MASNTAVGGLRRRIVLGLLASMLGALLVLMLMRAREQHDAPQGSAPAASASASGSASASQVPSAASGSASAPAASSDASAPVPKLSLGRTLRVVGSGWDTVAAALLSNEGLEPGTGSVMTAAGLDVRVTPSVADRGVESALARGGEDKEGADIGILPLPEFVASYERMRALSPQIFFVTGWSRGREGLWSQRDSLLNVPVKGLTLGGSRNDAAMFVGVFALELAGVPPASIGLPAADKPPVFYAGDRRDEAQASGKLVLTTADAPRLVPLVAVAQAAFVEKHSDVLSAWAKAWLRGQVRIQSDAADAARRIGAMQGAPEPVALVRRLGEIAPASLHDNARAANLAGRSPVTLDQLFTRTWQLWRASRVLTIPPPETPPVSPGIIASLVRSDPELVTPPGAEQKVQPHAESAPVLLSYRIAKGKLDEASLIAETGFLAGIFERSVLRVAVMGPAGVDDARTRKLIQSTADRFELATGRILAGKGVQGDTGSTLIEILSVP